MKFDRWTVLLLERREDAPHLGEEEAGRLQDAHLAHLARLHEEGHLLAAGPVKGPIGSSTAGVCIYRDSVEDARTLAEQDPAVLAGVFRVQLFSWQVPGGAMRFEPTRFPHSMGDVARE